jgi:hypothetical protein
MSLQYRHRSPFHLRSRSRTGSTAPLVIIDAPSPLGTAASTFVALGLLGSPGPIDGTSVAELRPPLRASHLPTLDELAAMLGRRLGVGGPYDLVGIGLGALVALRLAADGGPVRRLVAVDAPVLTYRAAEVLMTERFFGPCVSRPPARSGTAQTPPAVDPALAGALPVGIDAGWLRTASADTRPVGAPVASLPSIPDPELARVSHPVLCINSPRSDVVTGGDHLARVVPTARLLRLHTMDVGDDREQAVVTETLHAFLDGAEPHGPAYGSITPAPGRRHDPHHRPVKRDALTGSPAG